MWGGVTFEQREAAALMLPPRRYCPACRGTLPDDHPDQSEMHEQCKTELSARIRKQRRRSGSADRACDRCGAALSPQAQACLVCLHIVGRELPDRPWRW